MIVADGSRREESGPRLYRSTESGPKGTAQARNQTVPGANDTVLYHGIHLIAANDLPANEPMRGKPDERKVLEQITLKRRIYRLRCRRRWHMHVKQCVNIIMLQKLVYHYKLPNNNMVFVVEYPPSLEGGETNSRWWYKQQTTNRILYRMQ